MLFISLCLYVKLIQLFFCFDMSKINLHSFLPSKKLKKKKKKSLIVDNLTNKQYSFPVPRSALCPAEAAGHQLPPPVPS